MIYFRIQGNLGNVLFQRATALSLKRGRTIGVGDAAMAAKLKSYGRLFADLEVVSEPPKDARVVRQEKCFPTAFPPDDGRDLYIEGYFQSENYFDKDLVYDWAKPSDERIARLRAKYGDWLSQPGVTGISVRRGDYLKKAAWHPFVGERYFRDCMARLVDAVAHRVPPPVDAVAHRVPPSVDAVAHRVPPSVDAASSPRQGGQDAPRRFIVCSDGMDWCRRFFPRAFPDCRFLFVEGESVLDQLAIHTLCANNIVSNSSYSWWGAWLAERRRRAEGVRGVTLAPSMWLGYAPKKDGATWNDIYFDGMEVVENRYSPRLWLAAHWPVFAERA